MKKRVPLGADPKFKEFLNEIKIDRIKSGKDTRPLSDRRLTLAISRVNNLKGILTNSDMEKGL